jgi:hypothetical protein
MAAWRSGSVICGKSISPSIGLLQIAPDHLVFGLDLLPARMDGEVDAEEAQALESVVDGLGILPLHDMQLDLEMSGRRLVDLRRAA